MPSPPLAAGTCQSQSPRPRTRSSSTTSALALAVSGPVLLSVMAGRWAGAFPLVRGRYVRTYVGILPSSFGSSEQGRLMSLIEMDTKPRVHHMDWLYSDITTLPLFTKAIEDLSIIQPSSSPSLLSSSLRRLRIRNFFSTGAPRPLVPYSRHPKRFDSPTSAASPPPALRSGFKFSGINFTSSPRGRLPKEPSPLRLRRPPLGRRSHF
jgi:hypothetical protein